MHFIYGKIPQKFHTRETIFYTYFSTPYPSATYAKTSGSFSQRSRCKLLSIRLFVLAKGEVTLAAGGRNTLNYNGAGGLFGDVDNVLRL